MSSPKPALSSKSRIVPSVLSTHQRLIVGAAVAITVALRLLDLPISNFSSMVALAMLCGTAVRHPAGWLLPLAVRLVTDVCIQFQTGYGFFSSWPFDYSAYVLIFLVGRLLLPTALSGNRRWGRILWLVPASTLGSVLIYFLLSNFGVWLMWPDTYSRSLGGLLECYTLAIPFARGTLMGNMIAAPVFYAAWYGVTALEMQKRAAEEKVALAAR